MLFLKCTECHDLHCVRSCLQQGILQRWQQCYFGWH